MGSIFPGQPGLLGVSLVDKTRIDGIDLLERKNLIGDEWASAFVKTMNLSNSSGNFGAAYGLFYAAIAANGKIYSGGTPTSNPVVYDIASDIIIDSTAYAKPDIIIDGQGSSMSFEYNGECYFINSSYNTGSFAFRKYNPVSNSWTALSNLPSSPIDLRYFSWAFLGLSGGFAYFMPMVFNAVGGAPTNPTMDAYIYKYDLAQNTWSKTSYVAPWFLKTIYVSGNTLAEFIGHRRFCMGCKYDENHVLVIPKDYEREETSVVSVHKFNLSTGQLSRHCVFPLELCATVRQSFVFHYSGVTLLIGKNKACAYIESTGRYCDLPWGISIGAGWATEYEGKVYFSGYIIDMAGLAAFLNADRTIALNIRSFKK